MVIFNRTRKLLILSQNIFFFVIVHKKTNGSRALFQLNYRAHSFLCQLGGHSGHHLGAKMLYRVL